MFYLSFITLASLFRRRRHRQRQRILNNKQSDEQEGVALRCTLFSLRIYADIYKPEATRNFMLR